MNELAMVTARTVQLPPIPIQPFQHVPNLHDLSYLRFATCIFRPQPDVLVPLVCRLHSVKFRAASTHRTSCGTFRCLRTQTPSGLATRSSGRSSSSLTRSECN